MKRSIFLSGILFLFILGAFCQSDTIVPKLDAQSIFTRKKFLVTLGVEGRVMLKQKDYAHLIDGYKYSIWGVRAAPKISLNNNITPFLNFNINKYYKHWIFGIGTRLGAIIYSDKVEDYLERQVVKGGEYVLNVTAGIGYTFKSSKWLICPKINVEYRFLNMWMNKSAGLVYYYQGFHTMGARALLYLHSELSVFIPVRNEHFIIPKVEFFIHSFEDNSKFFNNYKGGNYYYFYTGIAWAF